MNISRKCNLFTVISSMVVFTVFVGFCLTRITIKARAVTESTNASVTVGSACTLAKSVTSAHTASVTNGSYYGDSGIGETLLQANCNDASGFAIYAIGYTGNLNGANYLRDNTLYGTYGDTQDIATGTGTSGSSNWSMKLTAVSNTDIPVIQNSYDSYHNVPSEYALVANKASGTTIDDGARVKATYTAYISGTQPAGTYEGKVKYALVHPATKPAPYVPHEINTTAGKICYYPNTNEHQGTMGCQTISASDTSVTLLASNFSRTGYGFAGWSDAYDYDTNPNAHFYGPNEDITFTAGQYTGSNPGLSLYAVWVESAGSFQDSTKKAELCGTGTGSLSAATFDDKGDNNEFTWSINAGLSSISALTDSRDNQTYAIAKLADDNCWMIENLRLESTASHNSDGILAQGYHSSFVGLAEAESDNFANSNEPNSLYSVDGSTIKTISGSNTKFRFPRYNNTNTLSRASSPTSNDENVFSYGNYYTWSAAIADTTNYTSGDHIATSICPSDWGLPIGHQSTADKSFGALSVALGGPADGDSATDFESNYQYTGTIVSSIFRSFPNNFIYSSHFTDSSAGKMGINGFYWSSSVLDEHYSYLLEMGSSKVYPGTSISRKVNGSSVRCLAVL